MKPLFLVLSILFCTHSFAQCFEFELIGEGQVAEESLIFIIAKETQSEVRLAIPLEDQDLFSPYIDRWAKSRVILDRPYLDFSTQVMKVLDVQYETPDPLNMMSMKNIKKIRKVACPKK